MEIDFANFSLPAGGLITYPEWGFVDTPLPPDQIRQTVNLLGSSKPTVRVTGSADTRDF